MLVLALLMTSASAQADDMNRKECRERLDAFYAEPARRCNPAADAAQTAKVRATQGRSEDWSAFYAGCEEDHMEFLIADRGCQDKFKEDYPNADWKERWATLEGIDEAVSERLKVFGCATDREPHLTALTACLGGACADAVSDALQWADRCNPESLDEAAAGIGYRKTYELVGMLSEEGTARAEHAELAAKVGELVKQGRADGLQLALTSPWCTSDKSYACGLDTAWTDEPEQIIVGLRQARLGDLERTRLGRSRLTGVRDPRQRILKTRELRPKIMDAAVQTAVAGGALSPFPTRSVEEGVYAEAPGVRRTWAANDQLRALIWEGSFPQGAAVTLDVDPDGQQLGAVVHGERPYAVEFEVSREASDVDTALRKIRALLGEDDLVALHRAPGSQALVFKANEDTQITYLAFLEGREAVVHKVVEHVAHTRRSAEDRAKLALDARLATGDLADPQAFSERTAAFRDTLDRKGLADAIDIHVGLLLATGDKGGAGRRLVSLGGQLDLWNTQWRGEVPAEEPEDPELMDPDAKGPATPRNSALSQMQLAIGGCAEAAWAEAAEAAQADSRYWQREAVWAELELAVKDLRGEDAVDATRRYEFAMRSLAESLRLRREAGLLAGERDAFRLKQGISRVDATHPAFWLAIAMTDAECN